MSKGTQTPRQQQIDAFLAQSGFADARQAPLAGDASFRRYIRIFGADRQAMLMDAPPAKENSYHYFRVARPLFAAGYSVPDIYAHDLEKGLLLLEDLGDDSFTRRLAQADEATQRAHYMAAVDVLAEWYKKSPTDANTLALPAYDQALLMQEVRLFTDWYLPQVLGKQAAAEAAEEYLDIWQRLLSAAALSTSHFVHRDYHADNLFWLDKRKGMQCVGLLDFQDAVYGDAAYDMVSLLEDARRDVPPALAEAMITHFIAKTGEPRERFLAAYALLGAQRNGKIVGIFTRLAARDGKTQYLGYLPRVWGHLERDLSHPALAELKRWMDRHVAPKWRGAITIRHDARDLALSA